MNGPTRYFVQPLDFVAATAGSKAIDIPEVGYQWRIISSHLGFPFANRSFNMTAHQQDGLLHGIQTLHLNSTRGASSSVLQWPDPQAALKEDDDVMPQRDYVDIPPGGRLEISWGSGSSSFQLNWVVGYIILDPPIVAALLGVPLSEVSLDPLTGVLSLEAADG